MGWWIAMAFFGAWLGCAPGPLQIGSFEISVEGDSLSIGHPHGDVALFRPVIGSAVGDAEMQFGSFKFGPSEIERAVVSGFSREGDGLEVEGAEQPLGRLVFEATGDRLAVTLQPLDANYIGFESDCPVSGSLLGLGSHALDVDHRGEAFPLWTSEPGIGKVSTDEPPADWFITGTRHATSLPMPFVLDPQRAQGWLVASDGRVDADLCASDPGVFSLIAWDDAGPTVRAPERDGLTVHLIAGEDPVEVVSELSSVVGRPSALPAWAMLPWNDAIRGEARVREVAASLRAAGASSSVIWTEDWKGAEQTSRGYHLTGEWSVDRSLYPEPETIASDLDALGFKWFAYFSPFVFRDTTPWLEAEANGYLIRDAAGAPYVFPGATFEPTSMVDLSNPAAVDWFQQYMIDAQAIGFRGWMADYAEWLPDDAVCDGGSGSELHNAWPVLWQQTNAAVLDPATTAFFARSGWAGTSALAPVVWAGDQKTSFDADDGLPTVVALGLGASASGIPVFTHDIGGYQTFGTTPGDRELYFRWTELGAFTPVMRTHHGAFDDQTWQFDSDAATLAHFARYSREHARLFPYLAGLNRRASEVGVPMLLPVGFRFPDAGFAGVDSWLLGDGMLVAPVLVAGATTRDVTLPAGRWYDWWTGEPATSGTVAAPVDVIPVFVAGGTTIPTFATIPEAAEADSVPDLADADASRVVHLFGGGGAFTEADGTSYEVSGTPSGPADVSARLSDGTVDVGGVTVVVSGPVEREYRFISHP
jgi:alpha-glucosidase